MTGVTARAAAASAMASECAPQPWSADTTRPSSGAYAFAQAPKKRPSSPLSGREKPQLTHCAGAACAMGDRGPCSLASQRSDAPSAALAASTRDRPPPAGVGLVPGREQVGDDAFALGLHAEMVAGLGGTDDGDKRVPREVHGLGAGLVWFPGSGAGGTHGSQFSLITQHERADTHG